MSSDLEDQRVERQLLLVRTTSDAYGMFFGTLH